MVSLDNGTQLVICITDNQMNEKKSLFPIKTTFQDKRELVTLLENNNLIKTDIGTETYIMVEVSEDKIKTTHTLKKDGTEFDFNTLEEHNGVLEVESLYVNN